MYYLDRSGRFLYVLASLVADIGVPEYRGLSTALRSGRDDSS